MARRLVRNANSPGNPAEADRANAVLVDLLLRRLEQRVG